MFAASHAGCGFLGREPSSGLYRFGCEDTSQRDAGRTRESRPPEREPRRLSLPLDRNPLQRKGD